jgi:hypothetical protein
MGFILKTIFAFCVVWGGLYAAQHYWLGAMMGQIADNSGLQLTAPAPAFPTMEIDPAKLQRAINPPETIDTKKYERLAIESMARQIDQQNRAALSHVPQPMSIPGLHH